MQVENSRPAILCFAGLDPSGGAGLQADIEAIAGCGGHALPIATCLTVQNASRAIASQAVNAKLVQQQAEALLEDMPIAGCKIGVLPNSDMVHTIVNILAHIPDIPIVLDPVIHATHGIRFCDEITVDMIKEYLLPCVQVITPNQAELQQLASTRGSELENVQDLCAHGTEYVFVTGADQACAVIENTLYSHQGVIHQYQWKKLPHSFHGSGCTLSSALSCFLALGLDTIDAVNQAQHYTWQSLQHADVIGAGQHIPKRI